MIMMGGGKKSLGITSAPQTNGRFTWARMEKLEARINNKNIVGDDTIFVEPLSRM